VARLALLGSPLVGPACWGEVGEALIGHGHTVSAPRWPVLEEIEGGFYRTLVSGMVSALDATGPWVMVAHSGAGAMTADLAKRLGDQAAAVILVDAIFPHPGRSWMETAPPNLADQLRGGVEFGLLPAWDRWWPPGALARLVPDPVRLVRLVDELAPIPLAFLEEAAPPGTMPSRVGYLQLSGAYDEEGRQAVRQGWPVVRLPLHHLAMLTHAESVAGAIHGLVERLAHD
jgi:pimeloyl-ACP methyl ester carboxylesterase